MGPHNAARMHTPTRWRAFAPVWLCAVVACSDALGPDDVAGQYGLARVNGSALPATVFASVVIHSGTLTLLPNGRWEALILSTPGTLTDTLVGTPSGFPATGGFEIDGRVIRLRDANGVTVAQGSFRRDTLLLASRPTDLNTGLPVNDIVYEFVRAVEPASRRRLLTPVASRSPDRLHISPQLLDPPMQPPISLDSELG